MKKTIDLENHKSALLNDRGKGTVYADLFSYGKTVEFNAFYLDPGEGLKIDRLNGRLYSKATHKEPDETKKFKTFEEGIDYFNQFIAGIQKDDRTNPKETSVTNETVSAKEESTDDVPFDQVDVTMEGMTDVPDQKSAAGSPDTSYKEDANMKDSAKTNKTARQTIKSTHDDKIDQAKDNITKLEGDEERKAALIKYIESIRDGMNEEQANELYRLSSSEGITLKALEVAADYRMSAIQMHVAATIALGDEGMSTDAIKTTVLHTQHETTLDYLNSRKEFKENLDTIEKAGASSESVEQAAEMYTTAERDAMDAEANLYKMTVEEALAAGKIALTGEEAAKPVKEARSSDKEYFDNANQMIGSYFRGMRDTAVDFMKKVADIPRQTAKDIKDKTLNAVEHFQDKIQNIYETKYLDYTKKQELSANTLAADLKEQIDKIQERHKGRLDALYHLDGLKRFITGKPEISKEDFVSNDQGVNSRRMQKLMERYEEATIASTSYAIRKEHLEESIQAYHEKWEDRKYGGGLDEKLSAATETIANGSLEKDAPVMEELNNDVR